MWPLGASNVLPCIGSQTHGTSMPSAMTALISGGSTSLTRAAPIRVISVSRPGSPPGFSLPMSASTSDGVAPGPTLTPTGLRMLRANSMWAPSRSRVRSPTQTKCADVS